MHTIWIHHESPLFHKPTEIPEYIPLFIYKQKDEPTPVAPTDIYWRRTKSIEIIVGITFLGCRRTVSKRSVRLPTRLPTVSLRLLAALSTFGGDNGRVVVRRPHGGRTITCHYLPLLCDLTRRKQVFEHFQNLVLNLRSLAITLVIAEMPYCLSYVHLRLLAFTCDNLSQPFVTYRNS